MVEVRITDEIDEAAIAELRDEVIAFNVAVTGYDDGRSLGCFVRDDDGTLLAGIDGYTWGGAAKIDWLWVSETMRGEGLGRRLVEAAEAAATDRGCHVIRVDTHSFQAPSFYAGLGYEEVGYVGGLPTGHGEHFFAKRLPAGT